MSNPIQMREDQVKRMKDMTEKLSEVFFEEVEMALMPDSESVKSLQQRLLLKKNAGKTLVMVAQMINIGLRLDTKSKDPAEDGQSALDKMIAGAEKRATELLERHEQSSASH